MEKLVKFVAFHSKTQDFAVIDQILRESRKKLQP